MLTFSEENHLKSIFHLSSESESGVSTNSIADNLNTKASSVTEMLKKLNDKLLIVYKKYHGAQLTEKGRKTALNIIRKHRLWEVFLVDKLNFKWDEVHDIAEQLEHIQSEKLTNELDKFLDFPTKDPHGDPIPNPAGFIKFTPKLKLSDLNIGETGKFVGVKDSSSTFLKYLDKRQISLGSNIKVLHQEEFDQSLHVGLDESNLTISIKTASNLYITKI
ncbi:metal-dependent transcriptional regulator [Flavobacteriaceae bacterium]|jgi:DtxR family Mn-dependent transcriptional regulator|nr:metal-dependent transcriptional regulator [Flavobacteriaceae bacterium]MDA9338903.1 metal-dependent transcriptional regulator [Flavobacteriaceae bacterium]MDB4097580.1 metal-dependent transcriptional regulator [Flavobacteriaceae bacterium]MDB4113428.1 metal-dependent transcriptional regulator [Flavobacteriaceae bacterium]MDC0116567.1 metal-dependent transcriptional regulator [Flavobacteriaceae bacterium]|tara:strand:- start:213 stop:869 length:657 start_codon:yes stop_codon:yes gene_type:complete